MIYFGLDHPQTIVFILYYLKSDIRPYPLDLLQNGLPVINLTDTKWKSYKMYNNFYVLFDRGQKVISTTGSAPTMSAKTVSHWTRTGQNSRVA